MCKRLTLVDGSMLSDHYYLTENDYCTFIGEYTARKGFGYSDTNQLIFNFKKSPKLRGTPQWRYKEQAVQRVGGLLGTCLAPWADEVTLVPVPPSKCKTDTEYDNRIIEALDVCKDKIPSIEYREIVTQTVSTDAAHLAGTRPTPEELMEIYEVNEALIEGTRGSIIIVDDMLTTGCHYRAMETVLRARFPDNRIAGLFIARRVPDSDMFTVI